MGVLVAIAALLLGGQLAHASAAETTVGGTLQVRSADGSKTPVAGAKIVVSDTNSSEVGSATTAADGTWMVAVPGAGTYSVMLDESTLTPPVTMRSTGKNPAEVRVNDGEQGTALFALTDGTEPAATQPSSTTPSEPSTTDPADGVSGDSSVMPRNVVPAVQLLVDGLKLGLIIAMCAVGLSLIYGTTGLVNFAHGEIVTFGAMIAYLFNNKLGLPGVLSSLIFGAIIATLLSGVAGGAFNRFVWRPLRHRGASLVAALVVSIGFSILFRYMMVYVYGSRTNFYRDYQGQSQVNVLGLFGIVPKDIVIMTLSVLILVGVALGLERTKAGKAMRAVADNRDLAESSGIDVETVIQGVWIVGGALAGLGGVFFGLAENINWEMGFRILLLMFAGITLGGLGTAYGALVGSLIIGVLIQLSTLSFGPWPGVRPELKNVGALLLMVVILLFRPQGLMGRSERVG